MSSGERVTREHAIEIGERLKVNLLKFAEKVEIAGSVRRGKRLVGDLDIAVAIAPEKEPKLNAFLGALFGWLKSKPERGSRSGEYAGMQVQVVDVPPEGWGSCLLMTTGSAMFNVRMRGLAKMQGYKLNRYGLWLRGTTQRAGDCTTEEAIFQRIDMKFVPPEDRGS